VKTLCKPCCIELAKNFYSATTAFYNRAKQIQLAYIWAAKFGKVMQAVLLVKNRLIDFNLQKEQ
jgi:hypothetical protein